jgi:uncharacterized protein (DUF2235 family)
LNLKRSSPYHHYAQTGSDILAAGEGALMPKNIVICCDGTSHEFGDKNSNVVKLYSVLAQDPQTQVAFYHPGVGSMGAPTALSRIARWWTRIKGLAFGYGLTNDIADAYSYLMETYQPGDSVYLFGFSRGAYEVRALAAMLFMYGLLRPGNEVLVRYMVRLFRGHNDNIFDMAKRFKPTFSIECKPAFLGVWDTVSSVGWIYNPVKLPYTARNTDIRSIRHAVSIDERRAYFRQNLWNNPAPGQNIQQVWFAGTHSDVGGGHKPPEGGLSKITLEWMLNEAMAAGLLVDSAKKDRMLGVTDANSAKPDPMGTLHPSLRGFWWLLELWPKRYWDTSTSSYKWMWPLGRPRYIAPGSWVHRSVQARIDSSRSAPQPYRPPNLPKDFQIAPDLSTGASH